jgi:hypothetical protein
MRLAKQSIRTLKCNCADCSAPHLCTQADADDDDRVSEMYYTTHTIALLSCATMLHDPDTNLHYVRVLHVHGSTTHSHVRMDTTHMYTLTPGHQVQACTTAGHYPH